MAAPQIATDAPRKRNGHPCLVLAVALCLLLIMTTRNVSAAPPDPPPCDPANAAANRCLVAVPLLADQLTLRAAGDGRVFAQVTSLGDAQLRVLDADTLATRGVLSLAPMPLLYHADHLYTTATPVISTTPTAQMVLNVGASDRPAVVGGYTITATTVVDWAITPAALFVLTSADHPADAPANATQSAGLYALQAFALDDPARPHWVATLPNLAASRLYAHAGMLYVAGTNGLIVINPANPRQLVVLANAPWPEAATVSSIDLAAAPGVVYAMGTLAASDGAFCTAFDVRLPAQPVAIGVCPFIAHKTTFAGAYAYVNPNASPAEYLDYQVYALANPAAPAQVGVTTQRWRTAVAVQGGLVIQTLDGRIARVRQSAGGSLTIAASTWSVDAMELDGAVRTVVGDMAVVDSGTIGEDGARLLRLVDIAQRTAPEPRGTLASAWIGARHLTAQGTQLLALHRDRLTIFDVRNPAQPLQIGQFTSPLGDSLEHMIPAGPQTTFLLSDHNTLLSVVSSTPTTPTLAAMLDLPGRTQVAAWANGALFLFADDTLYVVDVADAAKPRIVRSLAGLQAPAAVTTWGPTLYLVDENALQLLDVADAASPLPGARLEPPAGMRFTLLGAARNNRLALQVRKASGGTAQPYVAMYDLAQSGAPRLVATVPGDFTDAYFDGARLILPGMRVVAVGPGARWTAPLPKSSVEPFTFAPVGDLPPGVAITYTLASTGMPAPGATRAAAPLSGRACLQHESDPNRRWLAPLGQSTYAGPFTIRSVDCATGATVPMETPIVLTVALPTTDLPPYTWSQAALYADEGHTWTPLPNAQVAGGVWSATVNAPIMWGVRGPMPDPVLLPIVAR